MHSRGEETRILVELFASRSAGTLISYEEMEAAIGRPIRQRRDPYYSAKKRLEKEHNKSTKPVIGRGYRICYPNEHAEQARDRQDRAMRQINRGVHTVRHTDLAAMTESDRQAHFREQRRILHLQREIGAVRRRVDEHDVQITNHERRLDSLDQQVERFTPGEMAALRQLLAHKVS